MKHLLSLLLFLFFLNLHAQERILMEGVVKKNDTLLENVHIKNITTSRFSVSNASGAFSLNIGAGDTLVFSHVGMQDLISFVSEEDLSKSPLIFEMSESSMELREVVLDEDSEINAVSLGIIPKKIKKLSVNERRLKTAGDFRPTHLLGILGGGVSIDAILNALNGRTKQLKRNVDIEKQQRNIAFLDVHYKRYMQKEMELKDQEIAFLTDFIITENELHRLIEEQNDAGIKFYLHDAWFRFRESLKTSSPSSN